MSEQELVAMAARGAQQYAERHPRPSTINAVQAAEMLGIHAVTVRKMIRDGRIALNKLGMIPIAEIDRVIK